MALYTKLFRIVLSNRYYTSDNCGTDFDIHPTSSTALWMEQRKVRIVRDGGGIVLIWLSQHYDHPLELFKQKVDGLTISFIVTARNSQIVNLSELEVGYPLGQVYYLHNRHTHSNPLLHKNDFISSVDLVKLETLPHCGLTQLGQSVFALIDIDFSYWMADLQRNAPIVYKICIKNRSTFWRYYLVDSNKRLSGKLQIVSDGDASYFRKIQHVVDRPDTYWTESVKPMELSGQYDRFFSLCRLEKKNQTILLENLPYPKPNALTRDRMDKKKLYSDIEVYV